MTGCEWAVFPKMKMSEILILNYWNSRPYFIIWKKPTSFQEASKTHRNVDMNIYLCAYMYMDTCVYG